VFENRVLRRIFGHNWEKSEEAGEHCIMVRFKSYAVHRILLG
jgi:hypothetical protein